MMTKIASAAAVLALAGAALANNPWNLRGTVNFDLGVGGNPPSAGIAPTTSFFQSVPFGSSNGGVDPAFAPFAGPDLFLDSYWALSSGPSTAAPAFKAGGYAGSAPGTITSPGFAANGNAYNPAGFATPGVGQNSFAKEVNGVLGNAIFIARLTTIGEGSGLVNTTNGGAVFGRVGVWNGGGVTNVLLTLNGPGVVGPGGLNGQLVNTYYLVSEVTQNSLADGTAVVVHDLYFTTAIPTPGALALFGLAGVAAVRRRRSA